MAAAEHGEAGRRWVESLPALVKRWAGHWSLRVGEPYADPFLSYVLQVETAAGEAAALSLTFPDLLPVREAAALRLYDGDGACRLLAAEPAEGALLLERLEPGTKLLTLHEEPALEIAAGLAARLWRPLPPGHPFPLLEEEAARESDLAWERYEELGRPCDRRLLDAAMAGYVELAASTRQPVLLHGDLNLENFLAARREPWLVIDPKGLAGDRAYDLAPLVRERAAEVLGVSNPRAHLRRRLDLLAERCQVDRERLRGWTLAHLVEGALWDLSVGRDGGEWLQLADILFRA